MKYFSSVTLMVEIPLISLFSAIIFDFQIIVSFFLKMCKWTFILDFHSIFLSKQVQFANKLHCLKGVPYHKQINVFENTL